MPPWRPGRRKPPADPADGRRRRPPPGASDEDRRSGGPGRQLRQQAQNCLAGQSDLQSKTGGISDRITRCKEQQAALAAERQGAESRLADLRQLMTDLDGDCRSQEEDLPAAA